MKALVFLITFFYMLLVQGCTKGPEPIMYDVQECAHCRMTISDRQFSAQAVNTTGRTFSFDAIECMVNYIMSTDGATYDHITVASFERPYAQIDAKMAFYLIHDDKPSPMGGFLSAYSSKEDAERGNTDSIGRVLSWDQLLHEYSR